MKRKEKWLFQAIIEGLFWGLVFASIVIVGAIGGYLALGPLGLIFGTLTGFLLTVALSFIVYKWHVKRKYMQLWRKRIKDLENETNYNTDTGKKRKNNLNKTKVRNQ